MPLSARPEGTSSASTADSKFNEVAVSPPMALY
jgi:hypothetical protein